MTETAGDGDRFGHRVAHARKVVGAYQEDVEKAAKLTPQHLSKIEKGSRKSPEHATREAISDVFASRESFVWTWIMLGNGRGPTVNEIQAAWRDVHSPTPAANRRSDTDELPTRGPAKGAT